jgi:hypothetical protein
MYLGESKGASVAPSAAAPAAPAAPGAASTAIAPVPASSEAPAKAEDKSAMDSIKEFSHKKIAGPVEVWHVGAGIGVIGLGYIIARALR